MSLELFEYAMLEATPYCSTLCLAGAGEFLCDPLFHHRIKILNHTLRDNPGLLFWQTTNGSLLTADRLGFLEGVRNVGFTVSLDSAYPPNYEWVRRPGKWQTVSRNLRMLRDNLYQIDVNHVGLQLNAVLMKSTAAYLPYLLNVGRALRAKVFVDHPEGFGPDYMREESLFNYPAFSNAYLAKVKELAEQWKVDLSLPPPFAITEEEIDTYKDAKKCRVTSCYQLDRSGPIQIWPDGTVTACCREEFVIGNLNHESFKTIFNGEKFEKHRAAIAEGKPLPPCDRCRHLYRESEYLYDSAQYRMDIPPESRNLKWDIDLEKEGFFRWKEQT